MPDHSDANSPSGVPTKPVLNLPVPVLPLRDIVVFPHMIVPLFVGREKSVRALEEVMNEDKQILLLTQKNAAEDDPTTEGLHTIGTMATVLQLLKLPDQTVRVLVEGGSVTDAALESGYASVSAYIAAFKQTFGCTPGAMATDDHKRA